MAAAPKRLLQALEIVTARKPPAARPESVAAHHRRVRAAFEDRNIVAVGISEKITARRRTGALSLCFYVVRKMPLRKLDPERVVPQVVAVRDGLSVFTDVKEIGRVVPQVNKRRSPLQSGYSTAHFKETAGTLGALVQKAGRLCILSNSHVLALSGTAKKGDPILYPAPFDGGKAARDAVARLSHFRPFKAGGEFLNRVDAALAEVLPARAGDVDFAIAGAKPPLRTIKPERGMRVVKMGRTTGVTESVVEDVNFRVVIDYEGVGQVGLLDQVLCQRYTQGGDSGSIVVDKDSGRIVGLHFAGASGGSVFTPIGYVIDELGFEFASRPDAAH
jgi:hypothetical protein